MDKKHVHFVKILITFFLRLHQIIGLRVNAGEGSKNLLPEPDSSNAFWQLGCQVAALFTPLCYAADQILPISVNPNDIQ